MDASDGARFASVAGGVDGAHPENIEWYRDEATGDTVFEPAEWVGPRVQEPERVRAGGGGIQKVPFRSNFQTASP
jgi:hypothetical protein